jgi:hypothetical protein
VVIQNGLHEHLDFLQYRLIDVTREIGAAFFGQKPAEALAEQ